MATPTMGHMNLCARERLLHPTTFWCKRFQKLCSVLLHAKRVNSLGECGFSFGHLCGEREALAYNLHIDRLADTSNPPHRFASLWFRPLCLPLTQENIRFRKHDCNAASLRFKWDHCVLDATQMNYEQNCSLPYPSECRGNVCLTASSYPGIEMRKSSCFHYTQSIY